MRLKEERPGYDRELTEDREQRFLEEAELP